jgi:4-amino-4-deoxy-L-arabinose transferase-like glycosyltransferase
MLQRLRPHLPLLAVLLGTLLLALPTLLYPLGRDQGEFAVIGRGLLQGRMPYIDLWNPKPPAIFFVYGIAISLFGHNSIALRAIDLLTMPAVMLCLAAIGRRLFSAEVGVWAALLFGVFYFSETFWTLTQNDGIALLPMCLAVLSALRARNSAHWLPAFVAGVGLGITFWFKYPFLLLGIALLAFYWDRQPARQRLRDAVAFATGALLVVGAGAGWLISIDAWEAFLESARVTAGYTALGLDPAAFSEAMTLALGYRWSHWGLLALLALAGCIVLVTQRTNRAQATRMPSVQWAGGRVIVWLLVALAMMLMQLRGYDYHWLPSLPPLALLGALALERLLHRRAAVIVAGLALLLIPAANTLPRTLPYIRGQEEEMVFYARFVAGEFAADESLRAADLLRERVLPGDSLYIWGFRPEIYYLSRLQPATRFIFQFPLVADWYPAAWREENVETLWAALPPYVLVAQVDYMPWVTGSDDDSATLLQSYADLNDWLIYNYERDIQIGNLFLWRRKS